MKMVRQSLFLTLYLSLVFACEYEQLHRLVPINFDVAVNCYWATFTPSTNIEGDYLWDFGDGNTSSERTPTHVYALAGQYEVSLRIVNEQGAGEIKKNLTINQPYSDNTFQTDDEFLGSYANFFDENITGGYDVLVTNFSSKLTSVYHFSDQGAFENIVAEGEKTRDYVAYFGSSSFNFELINNLEEGFADGIGRAALEGVYSFFIGEENKYLCTKKVVFEEEERTIFVLSVYGKDADTQEGFSIQSLFHGGWLTLPFEETNFSKLFFDMTITPNKGLLLAYSMDGNGVHVMKWSQRLEKEWETYFPDLQFEKGDEMFNIIDEQEPISIIALSEDAYVLAVADGDRYFYSDPGIFDAEPKTYVIKANQGQIDWQIIKDRFPGVNTMTLAANGDIVLCGSLAIDSQQFSSTYLWRLTPEGNTIFEKVLEELDLFPREILETSAGNFLIFSRALDFLQIDCGGNF